MSQFFVSGSGGVIPPEIATSYVTDVGTAVPDANVLNVIGGSTNVNNDNGIRVIAAPNPPDPSNNVIVQLTNRITGTVTTTDATPTTLVSLSLGAVPGVYYVEGDLVVYDVTDTAGAAYSFAGSAITDGAAATEIGTEEKQIFEQPAMTAADFNLGVTGNTAFIQVVGLPAKTLHWSALLTYRFVG